MEDPGDARRLLGGLDHAGVAADQGRGGHAGADGQREVPRADDHGDAARLVDDLVDLADELAESSGVEEPDGFARVELEKVDRFADVRVGFDPGLAALLDDDATQFVAASSHDPGGSDQDRGSFADRGVPPCGEGGVGSVDRRTAAVGGSVVGDCGTFAVAIDLAKASRWSRDAKSRIGSVKKGRPSPTSGSFAERRVPLGGAAIRSTPGLGRTPDAGTQEAWRRRRCP